MEFLNTTQAAEVIGVSRVRAFKMFKEGKLVAHHFSGKHNRSPFFERSAVEQARETREAKRR
jgi:predicted site-specific integrase-resolvase